MKKIFTRLTCLMVAVLVAGCGQIQANSSSGKKASTSQTTQKTSSSKTSTKTSATSARTSKTSAPHVHSWASKWTSDDTSHWHTCSGCSEKNDVAVHTFGDWEDYKSSTVLTTEQKYAFATITKQRKCTVCSYVQVDGTNILPEVRFTFDPTDEHADFATVATKNDLSRPEVKGKISVTNCPAEFKLSNLDATMKVRGNQTAGWAKKGFRIKFNNKQTVLGLNGGSKFKKWILLADAKDTCLIRTALGLYVSKGICKDDTQVWVSDYTPVSVYLNNQYWGFYYLAEQKEVKDDRIALPEVADGYKGTDIGYCFELDHYADGAGTSDANEKAKGKDGDPTFRVKYTPSLEQGRPSGPLAAGRVHTYTMLSDITDGPMDADGNPTAHFEAEYSSVGGDGEPSNSARKTSNSEQLTFIRDKVEKLYQILYQAAVNKVAKELDASGNVVSSSKTIEEVMTQYFDIDAWVDGFILHAYTVAPDLGYSSFYMSYDNSPYGDKKLRFDCPWDFDSNFGNRNNFYVNAQTDTYVENTYNTWMYLFNKLSFFINAVKAKWNAIREAQLFENMFHMMRESFTNYDAEIVRNHTKWPQNDAAHQPPNNFDEIRSPYKEPSQYKDAEAETISWCAKRVNYLESKWGTGRPNINTNA